MHAKYIVESLNKVYKIILISMSYLLQKLSSTRKKEGKQMRGIAG